jgi:hypothetical protein
VTNARGDAWTLPGDGSLDTSPETLKIAKAAVAQSDLDLKRVAKATGPLDYDARFKAVWDFTPKPTTEGAERIEQIIGEMLSYGDAATISALSQVMITEIDLLIAKLVAKRYVRRKRE